MTDLAHLRRMIEWCFFAPPSDGDQNAEPPTWLEALICFLLVNGKGATFLRRCRTLKEAQWKLRMLWNGLVRQCLPQFAIFQNTQSEKVLLPFWPAILTMPAGWKLCRHDAMSTAMKKVINLNMQHFLKGAPLKKLHVKMDELYDCILDWRTMDDFAFLFRNVRSVRKQASVQLPGTREVCPFGNDLCFPLDAALGVQVQSAASLIR